MEHYVCIVDLLGWVGRLEEAEAFIKKIPIDPSASVWQCLLAACRVHNNLELGQHAAKHLFKLDPENSAPYVLLSAMYAGGGDGVTKASSRYGDSQTQN